MPAMQDRMVAKLKAEGYSEEQAYRITNAAAKKASAKHSAFGRHAAGCSRCREAMSRSACCKTGRAILDAQ